MVHRAIIVDDEVAARENLKGLLAKYCPGVSCSGTAHSIGSATKLIEEQEPDIAFLDIRLASESGFSLVERLEESQVKIVFVTAYEAYAIQAIEAAASGYLLKPVEPVKLVRTIEKLIVQTDREANVGTLKAPEQKLSISHTNGFRLASIYELLYLRSVRGYTIITLKNGEELVSSRHIKHFEALLGRFGFCRIHRSTLINLEYLREYYTDTIPYAVMQDGAKLEISRRKKSELLKELSRETLGTVTA